VAARTHERSDAVFDIIVPRMKAVTSFFHSRLRVLGNLLRQRIGYPCLYGGIRHRKLVVVSGQM
jgi:hypothetical protein